MRSKDRDKPLPYKARPLDQLEVGVQRVAVICPVEDQDLAAEDSEGNTANEDLVAEGQDLDAEERTNDNNTTKLRLLE